MIITVHKIPLVLICNENLVTFEIYPNNNMKEKIYKYLLFSLLLINFWTLYGFFDFYLEPPGIFHGFGLGIFYFNSLFISIGVGILLLVLRLAIYLLKKKNFLKTNFFYILGGTFNINLCLISFISICLEILRPDIDFIPYLIALILTSIIFVIDIYKSNFKIKQ